MVRTSLAKHSLLFLAFLAGPAAAYGPEGHHTVGAIADRLLVGTNAATQVASLLGSLSLENAAVWADCAKGVSETTHKYVVNPQYVECAIYETPEGKAAMEDFVVRNDQQCHPGPDDEICHKGYHYADIAIQHANYDTSLVGARPTDIVGAIKAALIVLQGGPSPAPFDFKDKREALLVLTHYIGDVHQPLHVGAVYLSATGRRINPDVGIYDRATFTRGGNQLLVGGFAKAKLHGAWDAVPASLAPSKADGLAAIAKTVPLTSGSLPDWPQMWASETLKDAQKAFVGVKFASKSGKTWTTTLPSGYTAKMTAIKTERIEKAGARLAQVLETIWP
jgi:S1/P1 Nuclease